MEIFSYLCKRKAKSKIYTMKKILSFVALILISAMSYAAVNITVTPSNVDFGEVSIKGKADVEGSTTLHVSWTGVPLYAQVESEFKNEPEEGCAFVLNPEYIYTGGGYDPVLTSYDFELQYYADQVGTYTCKVGFYSYESDYETKSAVTYVDVKLVVTADAIVAKTTPFERVNATSDLHDGDTIVFVCESATEVCGPLDGVALTTVSENVKIENNIVSVPENAQMFKVKKYDDGWQFYTADTDAKRLHLDIESNKGSGAFTYNAPVAGKIYATWNVSVTNGVATVDYADADGNESYPVRWNSGSNGNRFKPYKSESTGSDIALYKKAGAAQEVQSKLTVEAIHLGEVEYDETAEVTVNYTAEHLESNIAWDITGADKDLFKVTATGNRTSGTLKVEYLGGATQANYDAKVHAKYTNAQIDETDAYFDIAIALKPNTVKLTKLEFKDDAPTTIEQGQSIDMSQYIVFTPDDAEDKSLTWTVDKSYQGEIDSNGVLTAKKVTGSVTVTATSVRVPEVSASHTLTIKEPTITDFTLSDSELTLHIGDKHSLTVTAFVPSYASATASYVAEDNTVVAVSKSGQITAKKIGDTDVNVTVGSITKACKVHVVATPVESISLPESAKLNLGSTLQLNPTILPAQAAIDNPTTYSSDNEEVATVSEAGLVTSVAEGEAVITATISDKTAQITIHVVVPAMFDKVTEASGVGAGDTIILVTKVNISDVQTSIAAGAPSNGSMNLIKENVTLTDEQAYAEQALTLVVGGKKDAYTLTVVGTTSMLAADGDTKIAYNSKKNNTWLFEDYNNTGVIVRNTGYTAKCISYNSQSRYIRMYAPGASSTPLYVYVRKFDASSITGVDAVGSDATKPQKIIRDGQLLIILGGETYTVTGLKR